jgi:Kef-type K+ transport system membrane component KefB
MSHLLQLLLLLIIIIAAAKLAGAAANRIGQPAVFGEILAGLLLGPTLLNILGWPIFAPSATPAPDVLVAPPLAAVVRDLADLGVILLMFIAGMETDLAEMRRVGRVAFWSATGGVLLPLVGGALAAHAFGIRLFWEGLFVGTILTATSVSISAQTLMEIGALRSKEGSAILGAAVIDDVMGIVLLSAVIAFARGAGSPGLATLSGIIVRIALFFALALLAGRYVPALVRAADRLNVSQGLLGLVLVVAFLYAWAAEYVGQMAAITGSYIAGVFFARTRYKERIDQGIHPLTYSMFVPVFFVSIGLEANARDLGGDVAFTLVLLLVAVVGKIVGCGGLAWLSGFSRRQSLRVGVGMISRGEVGLIVASYGLSHGIIARTVFSASVVMVLVTTMITPPLLRLLFPARPPHRARALEETVAGPPGETDGGSRRQ